jgi:predicted XRE-type DNA-binding protein
MTRADAKDSRPIVGSGDFLKDRGYLDPDEMRLKFALANEIALIVEERGLKQAEAAKLAELSQSDVSRIVNGIVKDYSVYRLMRIVTKLGKNVSIDFIDAEAGQGMIFAAERGSDYTPERQDERSSEGAERQK